MATRFHFVTTSDGVRIACAVTGRGPPLVRVSGWMTHIERDREGPVWSHWWRELSRSHTLIQLDVRGSGLSDRDAPDIGMAGWLRDLEAVTSHLGVEQAPFVGICHGGALAAAFTAAHPERVSRLVLVNSYAIGAYSGVAGETARERAETLERMIRLGWGDRNAAFREVFGRLVLPSAGPSHVAWLGETERLTASPENAARMWHEFHRFDIRDALPRIAVPTLVAHVRGDALVPFEAGRRLASAIPGAHFLPLAGDNHVLLPEDEAWPVFVRALREFLDEDDPPAAAGDSEFDALTRRERSVLDGVAAGLSNAQIADTLDISAKTVRNHVSNILDKLNADSRSQVIVRAREAGFGRRHAS